MLATAVLAGCGSSPGVPRISLDGIGRVRPDTPLKTVRQKWNLCGGKVRGIVEFEGTSDQLPNDVPFNWAVFTAGVETDTGIRIGSSAADVQRRYGRRLLGNLRDHELRIISARPPRTTIIFEFDDGDRVTATGSDGEARSTCTTGARPAERARHR